MLRDLSIKRSVLNRKKGNALYELMEEGILGFPSMNQHQITLSLKKYKWHLHKTQLVHIVNIDDPDEFCGRFQTEL